MACISICYFTLNKAGKGSSQNSRTHKSNSYMVWDGDHIYNGPYSLCRNGQPKWIGPN